MPFRAHSRDTAFATTQAHFWSNLASWLNREEIYGFSHTESVSQQCFTGKKRPILSASFGIYRHALNFVICKRYSENFALAVPIICAWRCDHQRTHLREVENWRDRGHSYRCTSNVHNKVCKLSQSTIACRVSIAYLRAWLASWYPLIKIVSGELITRSTKEKLGETKRFRFHRCFLIVCAKINQKCWISWRIMYTLACTCAW